MQNIKYTKYPQIFFKIALQKAYFDHGLSATNYVKYGVGVFGIGFVVDKNFTLLLWTGILYAIFCYILGRWMVKSGFKAAESEVGNIVNPFVDEMRGKLKVSSKAKKFK